MSGVGHSNLYAHAVWFYGQESDLWCSSQILLVAAVTYVYTVTCYYTVWWRVLVTMLRMRFLRIHWRCLVSTVTYRMHYASACVPHTTTGYSTLLIPYLGSGPRSGTAYCHLCRVAFVTACGVAMRQFTPATSSPLLLLLPLWLQQARLHRWPRSHLAS